MIDEFRFGKITINGMTYQKDLIIFPDHIMTNWWRETGHSLVMNDLREVIAFQPQLLIIGIGVFGRMTIPKDTYESLYSKGIEVVAYKTEAACKIYNQRQGEGCIVAALHLTC
jgi:hypothetical protein